MADVFGAIETVGKDIVKVIEEPFKFVVKAEAVIATAIKDDPEIKAVITTLVQKASEVGAAAVLAGGSKGLNLAEDSAALSQAEAFFEWFKATVVPLVEKVYGEIKTDLTTPAATPSTTPATAPATS